MAVRVEWRTRGEMDDAILVVDDADNGVTCVVRGDDLVTSTPRQLLLFSALGLPAPEFVHVPLVVGPDGYTGWHSHPGLLLITVKEGSIEFYDQDCVKHIYGAGQSFTEGAEAHAALNRGPSNARLLVTYILKKGEPRRIEAPQPKCGATLSIP